MEMFARDRSLPTNLQHLQIRNRRYMGCKRLKSILFIMLLVVCFLVQLLLSKNYSWSLMTSISEENFDTERPSIALEEYRANKIFSTNRTQWFSKNKTTDYYVSNRSATLDNASISPSMDGLITQKPLFCNREQIRRGHWKNSLRLKAPYESKSSWESTCFQSKGSREGELEKIPFQDWEWSVDYQSEGENGCLFNAFDVNRFCRLNANRTVAFLGDSITWQQFNSLNLLIGATDYVRGSTLIKTLACKENTKLIWMRDNKASSRGLDRIIRESDPDVIIFNRGAHFVNNTVLAVELNKTLVRAFEWQEDCNKRDDGRDCLLVWRTTAPGFPDCDRISGPIGVDSQSMVEDLISNQSNPWYKANPKRQEFHWWDFANQNALVENVIHKIKISNPSFRISFIDFYEMAILRPDNHIGRMDCLHWCLPGPPDSANTVLLHQMEVAASSLSES